MIRTGIGRFVTRLGISDSVFLGGNPPFQPTASHRTAWWTTRPAAASTASRCPFMTQDPIFKNPEAWTWNATYQREIGFNTTIEVGYVGRRGLNQQRERNINQLLPGTVQANPGVNTDYLRPYKGFSFIRATNNDGISKYNALQINLTRRYSNGLTFGAAYT